MKRLISIILIGFCCVTGYAQVLDYTLKPVSCSLGNSVYEPYSDVVFTFDKDVTCTMAEFIHAYIYCEGK